MLILKVSKKPAITLTALLILALIFLTYKIYFTKDTKEGPDPEPGTQKQFIYGELLGWEEVQGIFPKGSKALVIDIDTGLEFFVHRRGGTYHADVEPLTAEDTAVMKTIFDGEWSWQRRAIIVQLDDGFRIAGSMNGMPHGGGAIKVNNFNGHFCIHFKDCKTHISRKVNMAHQIMVWKAANKLDQQLQSLSPEYLIEAFFAAVDQNAADIAERTVDKNSGQAAILLQGLPGIASAKVKNIQKQRDEDIYNVDVWVSYAGSDMVYGKNISVKLAKGQNGGWIIKPESLLPLLDKEIWSEQIQWNENLLPEC